MFNNKVESDKGELEIVYDVQWKTPGNDDDKAKIIGIVDTPDTNLDWNTFKSYLIQNSGNMRFTTDDIRISYLDSDDDLIAVDSEVEFRECLKFSRIRARRGRKIMMKVSMISNGGAKPKDPKYNEDTSSKHVNPKLFCLKKKDIKERLKKPIFSSEKPCLNINQSNENGENKGEMPEWFEKYMAKFKTELVEELTSAVVNNVRTAFASGLPPPVNSLGPTPHLRSRNAIDLSQPGGSSAGKGHHHHHHHLHHVIEKRKKKKKMPEEDSSDCTDGLQLQWEEKLELLRHMQKINKREKKFEKKLDAKLEKLECKTKKIMEKKHSLWKKNAVTTLSQNITPASPSVTAVLAPVTSTTCDLVMDATPVDEYNYVPHVLRGELVHQIWNVLNDGQLPWTDETELRFAWGSKSLVPLTTAVKCPALKPGEVGKIKVTLRAPLFPGNFESYWHFHHQGRRFGHWLGCGVIVDRDQRPESPTYESNPQQNSCGLYNIDQGPLPVDLTMKCQQNYQTTYDNKNSTTDDMKIFNIEAKPEVSNKSKPDLVKTEPKVEEQTTQKQDEPKPVIENVIDTELEEYPRLESYTDLKPHIECFSDIVNLTQPEIVSLLESFSDASRTDDSVTMNKPDLKAWAQYLPHGVSNNADTIVADLLNITEGHQEEAVGGDVNVCVKNEEKNEDDGKFEKIVTGVKDLSLEETGKEKEFQTNADGEDSVSDSDNISIISGTVSVDSEDTEPSDEFVVIPMPCKNCEPTIEAPSSSSLPVTQPISVEIPKSSSESDISAHAMQTSDNNNNMEMKPPYVCIYGAGNCPTLNTDVEINDFILGELKTDSVLEAKEDFKPSDDENTVYVRDSSGKSIPVAKVIFDQKQNPEKADSPKQNNPPIREPNVGFGSNAGIRHSTFGDPSFGQGPNGPRFPFSCGNDTPTSQPHCHNPGGACNFRPQHESPNCNAAGFTVGGSGNLSGNEGCSNKRTNNNDFCNHIWTNEKPSSRAWTTVGPPGPSFNRYMPQPPPQHPPQCPYRASFYPFEMIHHPEMSSSTTSVSSSGGASGATWTNGYHNIHTEQPRACKYTYVYNTSAKENKSATNSPGPSNKSSNASRRSSSENHDTSPVAAAVQILPETLVTGAVNVASSAINTARSVIDMLRPRHDDPVIAQWEQVPTARENSLRMLNEMGFNNRELNIMLLSQHNNDMARVISELVK